MLLAGRGLLKGECKAQWAAVGLAAGGDVEERQSRDVPLLDPLFLSLCSR